MPLKDPEIRTTKQGAFLAAILAAILVERCGKPRAARCDRQADDAD